MNQTGERQHPAELPPIDNQSKQVAGQSPRSRRYWGMWIAAALLLPIPAIQWASFRTDHQIANIVTAVLVVAAVASLLIGWLRRPHTSRRVRFAPLAVLLVAASLFALLFKPVGVSGELIPQFAFRFAQRASPPVAAASDAVPPIAIGPADFPGFLGLRRDGRIEHRAFDADWDAHRPELLWRQPIGAGWSGFAVAGYVPPTQQGTVQQGTDPGLDDPGPDGREKGTNEKGTGPGQDGGGPFGFTLEQREDQEWVTCYDLSDGRLVWHHAEPARHSKPLGGLGPRSTPTVSAEGRVYAQGATGIVWCLDATDGSLLWRVDLLEMVGIDQHTAEDAVRWGRAGSPLIVDDLVVVPLGGSPDQPSGLRSLVALDAATGLARWVAGSDQISYASPVLATLDGVRQILTVNESTAAGHDPRTGEELWSHPWSGASNGAASCSNPVPVGDNRVLLSKGYGSGAMMLEVKRTEEGWSAESVWADPRVLKTKFTNVCVDGHYGYALSDGALECVRLSDGQRQWKQPRRGRYGHGQLLIVQDVLVVLSEEGELAAVALDPTEYRELARFQALEGKTWNPPAVVGNLLVVRNGQQAAVWRCQSND